MGTCGLYAGPGDLKITFIEEGLEVAKVGKSLNKVSRYWNKIIKERLHKKLINEKDD
jgi:hypothetical protein